MIRTAALVGALAAWALVAYGNRALALMNPVLLPTPGEVVAVAAPQIRDGSLARHLAVSSLRIVEGFGLAAAAALGLGLLVAVWVPARLALAVQPPQKPPGPGRHQGRPAARAAGQGADERCRPTGRRHQGHDG